MATPPPITTLHHPSPPSPNTPPRSPNPHPSTPNRPLGVFHGTVTKSRVLGQSLLYYVSYDDGDDEELEECVLLELLNEVNMEGKDESEDGENRVPDSQVGFR